MANIGNSLNLPASSTANSLTLGNGATLLTSNILEVKGSAAFGSYAGTAAPSNGVLVSGYSGFGISSPTASLHLSRSAVATSGSAPYFQLDTVADTTLTTTVEVPIVYLNLAAASQQWATGTIANQRHVRISQPTMTFVGGSTVTNATVLEVDGPTAAGTNATLTATHGILVGAGTGGAGTQTNVYGIYATNPGFGTRKIALYADNASVGFTAVSPPSSGMIVNGNLGVGTSSPASSAKVAITPAISSGSVTTGLLVNPTYTVASGTLYGQQITSAFNPPTGDTYTASYGLYVAPTSTPVGTGTTTTSYGLYVAGTVVSANTVSTSYGAYIAAPSGAGTITTNIALYADNLSVGYASNATPTNGLIISGSTLIGTTTDDGSHKLQVSGTILGTAITLTTGATNGYVLTSDASGNGTWQVNTGSVSSVSGTTNQIVASPSTGAVVVGFPATAGISIGSYQANSPPTGGILMPGPLVIGTTALTNNGYVVVKPTLSSGTISNGLIVNPTYTVSGSNSGGTGIFTGTYTPPAGSTYPTITGFQSQTTVSSTSSGAVTTVNGLVVNPIINMSSTGGVTTLYGIYTQTTVTAGTVSTYYGLYVDTPSVTGSITTGYTAILGPTNAAKVGIGTNTPANLLDVNGGVAIGSYAGSSGVSNGLVVSGQVGVGTATPDSSSVMQMSSTSQGLLIPSMTFTQKNAISSPAVGLTVFDSTESQYSQYCTVTDITAVQNSASQNVSVTSAAAWNFVMMGSWWEVALSTGLSTFSWTSNAAIGTFTVSQCSGIQSNGSNSSYLDYVLPNNPPVGVYMIEWFTLLDTAAGKIDVSVKANGAVGYTIIRNTFDSYSADRTICMMREMTAVTASGNTFNVRFAANGKNSSSGSFFVNMVQLRITRVG
jgi:hypothetical protein